jgi:hypothetical protein
MLKEAISRTSDPFDGQSALRFQVLQMFGLCQRLHDGIDLAFNHRPFIPGLPPTALANIQRFKVMIELHLDVTKLSGRAMELWFLGGGLKSTENWVPLQVERCRQEAKRPAAELSQELRMGVAKRSA